jgi:hypothetical protein
MCELCNCFGNCCNNCCRKRTDLCEYIDQELNPRRIYYNYMASQFILRIRSLIFRKKNTSTGLFAVALKNENNGLYEDALINYETALAEIKNTRSNRDLKTKIIGKIKLLRTLIQYQKNF